MSGFFFQRHVKDALLLRLLPEGGLAGRPGGLCQVDSTAWGALALGALGGESGEVVERLCVRLVREQCGDGRVAVDREHLSSCWPTPLAILAWEHSSASRAAQQRAAEFLLKSAANHFPRRADVPWAHDTALKGWPWIEGTHSWVEPTALCVLALRAAGYGLYDRVQEAIRMLLDRQLPHGGWNYGNTLVFGRELHPMPESTGAALAGLAGQVPRGAVARSLAYLQGEVDRLRTPVSLGWSLAGLAAWGLRPPNGAALAERCVANQSRYGAYDTAALCLLLWGASAGEAEAPASAGWPVCHVQAAAVPLL